MKSIFNSVLIIILFFLCCNGSAQETLTLEQAIKTALQNNFEIKISQNELLVDKTNVTIGNAGMLPALTGNFIDNNSVQSASQTGQNGVVTERENAKNMNLNYGVGLDWTVFDGFRMFARYDQLKELQKLGDAELKFTIISRIADVISTYYDLVQQQQQLSALDSTIVISNQRLELAKNRFTIGRASKLEVLNAQVDLNTDTTTLLQQKELYANTKTQLNQILARDLSIDFNVVDNVQIDENLLLPELIALAEKQNPQLQAQIINRKIAELELKQVRAARYPTIVVNSGYNFTNSRSDLGFAAKSSSRGLTYGFTARLNIFNGFNQNRNEKVARIQLENTQLTIDQQKLALNTQLTTAYQSYLTNLELTKLEQKNEAIAKQNLDITLDKFRIGTITTLEFRTAQLNYINAIVRNNNAQLQAKLSEIALKELAGTLNF
ncbi:MAG TPA: TolC family protein [Flavobacterium sp.]